MHRIRTSPRRPTPRMTGCRRTTETAPPIEKAPEQIRTACGHARKRPSVASRWGQPSSVGSPLPAQRSCSWRSSQLWLRVAVVLTVLGVIGGQKTNITSQINLPAIPISTSDLPVGGLIGLAIVLVVTLIAAILGGLSGMRFHRRVDRAGFDTSDSN